MTDTRPLLYRGHHRDTARTHRFLHAAVHPSRLAATLATGPHLAAQAALLIDGHRPRVVVELGAGHGGITDALHRRLAPGSTLLAVDIDAKAVVRLRSTRPWLHAVVGDAAKLPTVLAGAGLARVDAVISSLPWTRLPADAQQRIVRAVAQVLHPGGLFATVIPLAVRPLPSARRLHHHLRSTFDDVRRTRPVWRNAPPAQLFVGRIAQPPPVCRDLAGDGLIGVTPDAYAAVA